jgi:hypothetical protein
MEITDYAQKYKITDVLLVCRPVSVTAAASLPHSGGPLTEKLPADLTDTKYIQNLPYLVAGSPSGEPLLATCFAPSKNVLATRRSSLVI